MLLWGFEAKRPDSTDHEFGHFTTVTPNPFVPSLAGSSFHGLSSCGEPSHPGLCGHVVLDSKTWKKVGTMGVTVLHISVKSFFSTLVCPSINVLEAYL